MNKLYQVKQSIKCMHSITILLCFYHFCLIISKTENLVKQITAALLWNVFQCAEYLPNYIQDTHKNACRSSHKVSVTSTQF